MYGSTLPFYRMVGASHGIKVVESRGWAHKAVIWSPGNGHHEVCYFDLVEDV